jgi:hypothetical protein
VLIHFKPCFDLARDFMYPSRSIVQENIAFDRADDRFRWKFLPWWRMSPLTLEFDREFNSHSEPPIELDQEDQVMKHNTSRVMKYNLIPQGTMSPTHGRKSGMGDREVPPPFNCSAVLFATQSTYPSLFLLPPPS